MGNRIKSERVAIGLSQNGLADAMHVSANTIGCWEREEVDIPASRLLSMRSLFNCSIDYLLGISDERRPV